jgi:hypothetical protein
LFEIVVEGLFVELVEGLFVVEGLSKRGREKALKLALRVWEAAQREGQQPPLRLAPLSFSPLV